MMSAMEWGALALWCKKNGWMPWGNNNYGKDTRETMKKGVPAKYESDGRTATILTGTGPVEYSHNKQLDGIYDLNGNVWEWSDGMRLVYGELQVLENNNAVDSSNSKAASSAAWKAIDGTTGALITPDGSGTTANSLKLDMVSSKGKWITGTLSDKKDEGRGCSFASVTADTNVCDKAKAILYALAMLPDSTTFDYEGDYFYFNNGNAERFPIRGGGWGDGAGAGLFYTGLYNPRSHSHWAVGFRSAFVE